MSIHQSSHRAGGEASHGQWKQRFREKERKKRNLHKKNTAKANIEISQGNESNKIYVTKRIQCDKCQKRFNKKETFKRHMESFKMRNSLFGLSGTLSSSVTSSR